MGVFFISQGNGTFGSSQHFVGEPVAEVTFKAKISTKGLIAFHCNSFH